MFGWVRKQPDFAMAGRAQTANAPLSHGTDPLMMKLGDGTVLTDNV